MSTKSLVLASVLTVAVSAQTGQGIVVGLVADASGAVIPNTKISVKDRDTGFVYSATSNEEGLYRAPYVNPGFYDVTYEAQGFKRAVRTNIQVRSTETARVDVTLEVGSVAEQIEVSSRAVLLETETSMTGHLVTGAELTKLPTPQMKVESML
ncbi:MAG: carboxypeptidase regulatory-like domain-containing protein [Acidobacteria bacterium]|nr:carboxypeptidase regulatory-like domain-containing protein [Acidobacteriota bacterium]